MPSVKIIHYTAKVYKNGTSPIVIQVIQGRKIRKKVIYAVLPEQWNEKEHRVHIRKRDNYAQINANIKSEYNRVEDLLLANPQMDIDTIFNDTEVQQDTEEMTFRKIADLYLLGVVKKSGWTYITFSGIINKFLRIVGNDNIKMSEIDERIVGKWLNEMNKIGNKEKTIHSNVKVLRFVSAFAERNGYAKKSDAIQNAKVPIGQKSYKTRLTREELQAFKAWPLPKGSKLSEIRDMFLLAVYLRGMRVSDIILLKQSDIVGGRVKYVTEKTDKSFDIKLMADALDIVERYKGDSKYLFSFYNFKPDKSKTSDENEIIRVTLLKSITANINNKLKKIAGKADIEKNISFHIARHTFARMAFETIKDTNVTMDLLGHSSMKEHELYIREILAGTKLDDAADEIFK